MQLEVESCNIPWSRSRGCNAEIIQEGDWTAVDDPRAGVHASAIHGKTVPVRGIVPFRGYLSSTQVRFLNDQLVRNHNVGCEVDARSLRKCSQV